MEEIPISLLIAALCHEATSLNISLTGEELDTAHKILHFPKANDSYIKKHNKEFANFISDLCKIQPSNDPDVSLNEFQQLVTNQKSQVKSLIYAKFLLALSEICQSSITSYALYDSTIEIIQGLYQYDVSILLQELTFEPF
ncbi:hypothetical protein RyT2_11660 [Pseudolactococcus yaeyamensis]